MLYKIIRFLLTITSKFYFKTLQVKGIENIPTTGPIFLVANHPAAFLDPMVLSIISPRPLSFLGKGVLFNNKILKWLLPKFGVIPIYRSHETKGQAGKNKDIFILCHKHFAKGGALLAFPEGISLTERKIKKIQSGTARICLGAEADYNYSLDIKIIPIGLNFSNPHKFNGDLFVSIDKPINVSDFYELYKQDTFKGAHALTDKIRVRLESQVIAIQDSEIDKLVANIELIYKAQILKDLGHSPKLMENDFNTTKSISDSVHYFIEKNPLRVEIIKTKINSYLADLERISLTDGMIKGVEKKTPIIDTVKSFFYLVLGFPLFLYGTINNFLPFRIPGWAAPKISKSIEFRGPISFAMGTFTFLIFYLLQVWIVDKYTNSWPIVLVYILLLPISGLFAFYYYKRFATIQGNWRLLSLFYKKTNLITQLITTRQQIIEELEKARKEFVAYRDAK
jgi:glycerol-3-phosphate O-acyltransferase / dihydroxyacetone phosphate acyltransferase